MNKSDLVNKTKAMARLYSISMDQLVVGFGGAMLLLGLRQETQDIDLDVPESVYDWFLGAGFDERLVVGDKKAISVTDCIDIHRGINPGEELMVTDGVFHHTPQVILRKKKMLNRPKDQKDIQALTEFLARSR